MAMTVTVTRWGANSVGNLIYETTRWSRVQTLKDGAIIADGVLVDIRGGKPGSSVTYRPGGDAVEGGYARDITIIKKTDSSYEAFVQDAGSGTTSTTTLNANRSNFPIIGNVGQTASSTFDDSVTELEGLKQAARDLHKQLNAWADGLDRYSRGVRQSVVTKGHNYLYEAHRAAWIVMGNRSSQHGFGSLTIAQRIAWAQAMGRGSADVRSPLEFYEKAEKIGTAQGTGPGYPTTWVNAAGTRLNLNSALEFNAALKDANESPPTALDTVSEKPSWIESLTG